MVAERGAGLHIAFGISHLKMGFGLRLTDGVFGDKCTPIGNRFYVCLIASSLAEFNGWRFRVGFDDPQAVKAVC